MAFKDDCPYGDEWRNGRLLNPRKAGMGYICDIEIAVTSESLVPSDAEIINHIRRYHTYLCYKEVVITQERYNELTSGGN